MNNLEQNTRQDQNFERKRLKAVVDIKGDIKSDLAEALIELRDTGFVYTLRGELLEQGTYRVVSKYLPNNKMTCDVFPLGEIEL